MQTSGQPTRVSVPFADSGAKNTIPVASQLPGEPGLASFTDGFPPATMMPLADGGIPPEGKDFNGILNAITNNIRWNCAGGVYSYNAAFSTEIGGYPKGAFISTAAYDGYWVSTVESNTSNPDTGGAGWRSVPLQGSDFALDTGTANTYTAVFSPAILSLTDGLILSLRAKTANTGASTLLGVPLLGGAQQPLQGGEIIANGYIRAIYEATISSFVLLSSTGASPQIPDATKSHHAVSYGQALSLVAAAQADIYIEGSASIFPGTFIVDTSNNASIILTIPPSLSKGNNWTFSDPKNTWSDKPWSLDLNGTTIQGVPGPLRMNVSNIQFSIFYSGTRLEFF